MSKWEKVAINTLCKINIGKTPARENSSYWKDGTRDWMTISDISEKYICSTKEKITDKAVSECRMQEIPANTVVMSFKLSLGKVGITRKSMFSNEAIASFSIIDKDKLDENFLYYALRSLRFENADRAAKGVTLNKSKLKQLVIPVPPLEIQQQIARELDHVAELLALLKKQLLELDQLIKSVFYEMFGDLAVNEKGWVEKKLSDISENDGIKCGPFGTHLSKNEFTKSGIPIWGIPQINSEFSVPVEDYVSCEKFEELRAYSIKHNDIVMSRKGNVGKCSLFPIEKQPGIMHSDVLRIRVNQEIANSKFVLYQLKLSNNIIRQIELVSHGAIMAGINVGKLKKIKVHYPPYSLQKKFDEIATIIESQKSLVKQSIDETQRLFDSLMSKYFDD